jgi:hypothetical protein
LFFLSHALELFLQSLEQPLLVIRMLGIKDVAVLFTQAAPMGVSLGLDFGKFGTVMAHSFGLIVRVHHNFGQGNVFFVVNRRGFQVVVFFVRVRVVPGVIDYVSGVRVLCDFYQILAIAILVLFIASI